MTERDFDAIQSEMDRIERADQRLVLACWLAGIACLVLAAVYA